MSLHPPKLISSTNGLGINTKKQLKFTTNDLAIGTELWGKTETPWAESDTIIAQQGYTWLTRWETGKPYIITKFYDDTGELAGIYCDVCTPVARTVDGFEFYDLYLDVWQVPGDHPVILDEDELNDALAAGYIQSKQAVDAQRTANELLDLINRKSPIFNFSLRSS